ncbi:MAG: cobaltochelatase subunit CobN [Alphaproteobacteria bacterium]|nr:cobaltochelatase subunit CobN [Alphaproteobacteria bacterium]
MHVLFVERHGLEETEVPVDLDHQPADLIALSFSDSDLGALAAGWHRATLLNEKTFPTLRLANLADLKHPVSVDTYIEKTVCHAKGILIRLIGGVPYWSYGLQQVAHIAKKNNIALAVIPADGRHDPQLDELSTVPVSTLRRLQHYCETGGRVAAHSALAQLAIAAGLYAGPVFGSKVIGVVGAWTPELYVCCPFIARGYEDKPLILITFYRSFIAADDLKPITALFENLRHRGFAVMSLFVPSLKAPDAAAWLERQIAFYAPVSIINATSFSGKGTSGTSPLDKAKGPVFQIALATSNRAAWAEAERGLSPADMAMHVVLPEVDGRIFAGVASFKESEPVDDKLQFAPIGHQPDNTRITAICEKVSNWYKLQTTPLSKQKPVLILSTYPGRSWQIAHAVGLDAIASAKAILSDLGHGNDAQHTSLEKNLQQQYLSWDIESYKDALQNLPRNLTKTLNRLWGPPEKDVLIKNGAFHFSALSYGNAIIALQPERGLKVDREADYHDISRTPCHGYVAFYLWLQKSIKADAIIHIGAHGTLEWLPGKAVALSDNCWPEVLAGNLPVIYPFIINDPGEAAQAKRRISAVTLGHIPPPLRTANAPEKFSQLESLLDEFSNADGLDPKRRDRLKSDIISEAEILGISADLGVNSDISEAETLTKIDAFVCDVKESQFGDGLHVFGRGGQIQTAFATEQSVANERQSIIDALSGKMIASGPSGSPYRGRSDVLPSGRNLFSTDPLSVPTKAAYRQGVKLAEEFIRRNLQDKGDWPSGVIIDLWGSATMRTAGEEFAMALHLLGVKPDWTEGSDRVSGFEILTISALDRPRIDVTLRVSGLFRDVFPTLSTLFQQAVDALHERDESPEYNPYISSEADDSARIFSPAPGAYGLGMGGAADRYGEEGRTAAAKAWINASQYAVNGSQITQNKEALLARIKKADSFIHMQDMPETDILLSSDYAAHEGGFAAAKALIGGSTFLYHIDNTNPEKPVARNLTEEIARVVYARAANPDWLSGMMRHGHRGAAEIAATLLHMAAFSNLANVIGSHLFDIFHDATLGNNEIFCFMQDANPEALEAMQDCFCRLHEAGLWETRRNSILASFESLK